MLSTNKTAQSVMNGSEQQNESASTLDSAIEEVSVSLFSTSQVTPRRRKKIVTDASSAAHTGSQRVGEVVGELSDILSGHPRDRRWRPSTRHQQLPAIQSPPSFSWLMDARWRGRNLRQRHTGGRPQHSTTARIRRVRLPQRRTASQAACTRAAAELHWWRETVISRPSKSVRTLS